MCGLFGVITPKWNTATVRALAICNRERGTDSLGFFDSSGRMKKDADDPEKVLAQEGITNWLERSSNGYKQKPGSWFIAGHTRLGTRGKAIKKNSHPFRYGNIIGSHNGIVDAPNEYEVDSQYLFDVLNQFDGDYNAAWGEISGYWGASWFDGTTFFLQVHNGDLYLTEKNGGWYYSSDDDHLLASVGYTDNIYKLKECETWGFNYVDDKIVIKEYPQLVNTLPKYYGKYSYTYKSTYYNQQDEYLDTWGFNNQTKSWEQEKKEPLPDEAKDWDSEWREVWEQYAMDSEHQAV
jgi:hypothetical protein